MCTDGAQTLVSLRVDVLHPSVLRYEAKRLSTPYTQQLNLF